MGAGSVCKVCVGVCFCLSRLGVEDDLAQHPLLLSLYLSLSPSLCCVRVCVLLLVVFNALFCVATLSGNNP